MTNESPSRQPAGPGPLAGFGLSVLALAAVWVGSSALAAVAAALGAYPSWPGNGEPIPSESFALGGLLSAAAIAGVSAILLTGFRAPLPFRFGPRALGPAAAALIAVVLVNLAGSRLIRWTGESLQGMPEESSGLSGASILLVGVLLAPVAEEVLFREMLLVRVLGSVPRLVAAMFTSVAFGLMHLAAGGPVLVASLAAMGMVLAWLRLRTGSLAPAVLVHGLNNLLALLMAGVRP